MTKREQNIERKRFIYSLVFPVFFLIIFWLVKLIEYTLDYSFARYGILPLHTKGLLGIVFSPLIHGDFDHLISNSVPFLVLSTGLFYFYRDYALRVFFLIYFFTGLWVWLAGETAYHIGASGVIYGLASFLFFSGLINGNKSLAAISLVVVFAYGSMIWGVLPLQEGISWESHLFGAITGFLLSLWYARKMPKTEQIIPEDDDDDEFSDYDITDENYTDIRYYYQEEEEE